MSPDEWRSLGQVVPRAGGDVFVVDSAPGDARPAVLCLHGFPTSSWDWAEIWPALTRSRRLVAFDFRGFGFSEKPRGGRLRIRAQADLAEAVARGAGLGPYHVLAHDYGDTVAQELLARELERPEAERRIRSMTFLNGGLFPEAHRPRLIQRLLASPLGPLLSRVLGKDAFERSFSSVFGPGTKPGPEQLERFWDLIARDGGRALFHRGMSYMAERRENRERWVGAIVRSPCPVLLVNGSADPVSGAHMIARYREVVPRKDPVVELPSIGHYPQVEAPGRVVASLGPFWESVEG